MAPRTQATSEVERPSRGGGSRAGAGGADGSEGAGAAGYKYASSPSAAMGWSARVRVYFERFPGFAAVLPPEAEVWTDSELDIYFGSNGEIWPRGKRPSWASKHQGSGRDFAGHSGGAEARPPPRSSRADRLSPELRAHFTTLDLAETTPHDVIRRHYRRLARECHPDKHPDDLEGATERFQALNTAYEAIKQHLRF